MQNLSILTAALSLGLAASVAGCASDGTGGAGAGSGPQTGAFQLRLVDAPADTVTQIVVTVVGVSAHTAGGGWQTLSTTTETVDLLQLQGGSFAMLGIAALPAGHITQLRLDVTDAGPNYVTTPDGAHHPLTVPSGDESGIKIKFGFDVDPCATGAVTLDFDGKKSIFTHPVGAGAGDEWILRPVVRLKALVSTPGTCEPMPPPDVPTVPLTPISTPPTDPCLTVSCTDGYACVNGQCQPQIM